MYRYLLFVFLFMSLWAWSQATQPGLEYAYFPQRDSDNSFIASGFSTEKGLSDDLITWSHYKRWEENWSYMPGMPKSNLKYYFKEKDIQQAIVMSDGFFAGIRENFGKNPQNFSADKYAESISMTIFLSGLGYEYGLTDHLKTGHRDTNGNDV